MRMRWLCVEGKKERGGGDEDEVEMDKCVRVWARVACVCVWRLPLSVDVCVKDESFRIM